MTATGPSGPPPRASSAGVNVRPSIAGTPSVSNMPPLAQMPSTNCVSPPAARLNRWLLHANSPSYRSRRDRICSQIGFVHDRRPVPLLITVPSVIIASCCGALTGSARSSRLLTSEKIAVLAPMPSASDSTATRETTGVARSARKARRRSCTGPPEGRIIYDTFRRSQRQDRVGCAEGDGVRSGYDWRACPIRSRSRGRSARRLASAN